MMTLVRTANPCCFVFYTLGVSFNIYMFSLRFMIQVIVFYFLKYSRHSWLAADEVA